MVPADPAAAQRDPFDGAAPAPPDLFLTPHGEATAQALAHFAYGFLLEMEGKAGSDEASRHYLAALKLRPNASPILERLIGPWLVRREFKRITDVLGPLAAAHPEASNLQLVVSEALAAQKKIPESVALLEKALAARDWAEPVLFRQLFVYYWQQKQFAKIERLIARARRHAEMRDRFVISHAAAAYWNARAQSPDLKSHPRRRRVFRKRALKWARRAAEKVADADRAEDVVTLARLFREHGDPLEAERVLRQGLEKFGTTAPRISLLLAALLLRGDRVDEVPPLLDPLLSRPMLPPELCVELGRLYLEAQRPEKAAVAYRKALFLRPRLSRLRIMLGYVYLRMDQPARCIEIIEDVKKPAAEVHLLRSHAWYESGELKKAARELALAENAARSAGNEHFFNVDYYLFYATLCEDMGLTDRAIEEASKALKLKPDDPVSLNFVGYVMADHNRQLDKAERLIRRALEAEPENVAYLDSLAWVLYRQKRPRQALDAMNRCLRLGGDEADPIILEHAGDIYAANGCPLLARRFWWEAIEAGVNDRDAERMRGKMKKAAQANGEEKKKMEVGGVLRNDVR
ncbi:MAG: tetratricopeptide repeat protein [Kiritimatiellaeota bacterium]|nr:tetratricopeptide repeat protein [Kiritimatiellota bacterium]